MFSLDAISCFVMFDRVEDLIRNPQNMLDKVGDETKTKIVGTFRSSSNPWGNAWPRLAPATVKARAKKGSASAIPLVDTSRMLQSLSHASIGDSEIVWIAGDERFPEVHQFGNDRIPAREMFPIRNDRVEFPPDWEADIFKPAHDFLEFAIK